MSHRPEILDFQKRTLVGVRFFMSGTKHGDPPSSLPVCAGQESRSRDVPASGAWMEKLQHAREEERGDKADDAADDDFAHAMSHALLETGKLALVEVEPFDEHIEVATLVAEVHADTGSIVHEDEGECGGNGKRSGADALVPSDADGERYRERGVCRGHMPVCEHVLRLPPVFYREDDEFHRLSAEADDERDEDDEIGAKRFHTSFV